MAAIRLKTLTSFILLLTCLPLIRQDVAQAEEALLKFVPENTNAIVIIDAQSLKQTPLAQSGNWAKKRLAEQPATSLTLPPDAEQIVLAALLNTTQELTPEWEVALISSKKTIPIGNIADNEQGYVDWIGSTQLAWSPANAYFAVVNSETLGVFYPANRQLVSHWLDWANAQVAPMFSTYLQNAASSISPSTQIVMAIDLKNAPMRHKVRALLVSIPELKADKSKLEKLEELLLSVQGITLKINVFKEIDCELTIDFSNTPAPLKGVEKNFVHNVLDRFGAYLSDLESWEYRSGPTSVIASGKLSGDGFRRVMSILELPSTQYDDDYSTQASPQPTPQATQQSTPAVDPALEASKAYFTSVSTLIEDLRKESNVTTHNYMLWYEKYARKIDKLPILNVDDKLLDYGASISNTFRDIAESKRTSNIQAGVRRTQISANVGYYDDNFSSNEYYAVNAEENADALKSRYSSWNEIEKATAEIRRQMTRKYEVEF